MRSRINDPSTQFRNVLLPLRLLSTIALRS